MDEENGESDFKSSTSKIKSTLRDPNPIMGCIIVLQIEHIDLEFNIQVLLPFPSVLPALPAGGRQQANRKKDTEEGNTTIT
jgi:hypothetical protein